MCNFREVNETRMVQNIRIKYTFFTLTPEA